MFSASHVPSAQAVTVRLTLFEYVRKNEMAHIGALAVASILQNAGAIKPNTSGGTSLSGTRKPV